MEKANKDGVAFVLFSWEKNPRRKESATMRDSSTGKGDQSKARYEALEEIVREKVQEFIQSVH